MGFFWDLFQQYQIGQQQGRAGSSEERIAMLERDIAVTNQILEQMAKRLDQLEDSLYGANNG
jgi:hypothetical protein